VSGTKMAFGK